MLTELLLLTFRFFSRLLDEFKRERLESCEKCFYVEAGIISITHKYLNASAKPFSTSKRRTGGRSQHRTQAVLFLPLLRFDPLSIPNPTPSRGVVTHFPLRPPCSASANLQMNACLSWPWLWQSISAVAHTKFTINQTRQGLLETPPPELSPHHSASPCASGDSSSASSKKASPVSPALLHLSHHRQPWGCTCTTSWFSCMVISVAIMNWDLRDASG